jgi:signal recognition particle subunit SRP54
MRLIKRMGSLGGLMKMIPGMNKIDDGMLKQGEDQLKRVEAMIGSMTESERCQPELLASQPSRRRRIATGSGHQPADVDKVLADFQKMRGFMQQMSRGNMPGMPGCLECRGCQGCRGCRYGWYARARRNARRAWPGWPPQASASSQEKEGLR